MGNKNSTSSGGGGSSNSNSNAGAGDRSNNATKKATKAVKKKVKFQQTKHPTEGIVDSYTFKDGKKNQMYGGQVSKATNEYLESIKEAKKGSQNPDGSYNYMLTSKGWKMKYGSYNAGGPQEGSAMGSGGAGVMSQIPISEKMFEQQRKIQTGLLAGLSVFAPIGVGQVMRAGAANAFNSTYGDYRKSFQANKAMGSVNYSSPTTNTTETANLAMGDTTDVASNNKKKSKTTKSTTKFFAGTGTEESTKKRAFYV